MRIPIIGGGKLGCAIAEGILSTESNNIDVTITRRNVEQLKYLKIYNKINITSDNKSPISETDYVI